MGALPRRIDRSRVGGFWRLSVWSRTIAAAVVDDIEVDVMNPLRCTPVVNWTLMTRDD